MMLGWQHANIVSLLKLNDPDTFLPHCFRMFGWSVSQTHLES